MSLKIDTRFICGVLVLLQLVSTDALGQQNHLPLALEHITVVDVKESQLNSDLTLLIKDGKISDIFLSGTKTIPKNCKILDMSGKFLLPGLIDGHTHLSANQNREQDLQAMLASGITSVRDMGGNAIVYKNLKERSGKGEFQIPDIYYSATFFGPRFMIDLRVKFAGGPFKPGKSPWMRVVKQDSDYFQIIADAKNAELLGLQDQIGSIEVGKNADLLILDQNPLEDIEHIRAVSLVIKSGKIVTQ